MDVPWWAPLGATLVTVVLAATGCSGDNDGDVAQTSSLTIVTDIDFTRRPFRGTFDVTEGADALGCSSGTFVDVAHDAGVNKVMTCLDGERRGTFSIVFQPSGDESKSAWRVVEASGDFSGVEGEGDFFVDISDDEKSGVETFTGEVDAPR